jgi:dipeptidase D
MNGLTNLEPRAVWAIFDEITRIPRPSKHEERIVDWLVAFARKHGLQYRRDAVGNVVILKPASAGMEHKAAVVLQNQVDMVCEKNADAVNASGAPFDFSRDAIQTYVTPDGWMRARGTTLGADNGLGMAAALALLIDPVAVHPPLEALFTVAEETGLTGAFNLGEEMITGKYLINLDSEDEGEVFIGCAGGVDTLAYFDFKSEPVAVGSAFFEIAVTGLLGGHSGDDIEKGRGNANKLLADLLWRAGLEQPETTLERTPVNHDFKLRLARIDGGNLRNAIPREARAVVALSDALVADFKVFVARFAAELGGELAQNDPSVQVTLTRAEAARVIDIEATYNLISALMSTPNGVIAMSEAVPGLVETSTNLASIKMIESQIVVVTSQRSSIESAKQNIAAEIGGTFARYGARVEHSDGYPGWAPNPGSHLLEVTEKSYERLFGVPIEVRAIHAGLECGLFLEKFPQLEMVSTGPTILGAHSPDERIEIATVDKFWRLLLDILRNL